MSSYRQVLVDGSPAGMRGLDETFEALHAAGMSPGDEALGQELVKQAGRDNFIPYGARESYAAALTREYAAYLALREGDGRRRERGYGTWRGYPREQIPWFPTVDEDACDGCGVCLRLCSAKALAPTGNGKVRVADPAACVVGCSSCAAVCKPKAIIFPPRSLLDAYPPVMNKGARP
jgi:NAD-dependent dihydropyrimidine dehydrogenase PreA subunit